MARGLLAGFCLVSESSYAAEDWKPGTLDVPTCDYQAWVDEEDVAWLDETNASQTYFEKAKANKFDFIGPAAEVPFKSGCGDVWVSACPSHELADKWLKLKDGGGKCKEDKPETNLCPADSTTDSTTDSAVATEQNPPTAPTEPGRATCPAPEKEPCEPGVTAKMIRAAAGIPGLDQDFHRHNHALEDGGAARKGVADTTGGAEVNDEVASWASDPHPSVQEIRNHYAKTAGGRWISMSRDSVAVVSQRGFSRRLVSLYQVYRSHDEAHFHNDAEGISLSLQHANDEERGHQLELATNLEMVKDKLSKASVIDHDSIAKTEAYRQLALLRARNLAAISCQLGSMAAIDADRENRQRSLASGPIHNGVGQGSGSAGATGTSTLTSTSTDLNVEVGPGGVKISTVTFTNVSTGTSTATSTATMPLTELEQTLAPFGPVDPPKLEPQDIGDSNGDLFARTHERLRKEQERGTFRGTMVEEDPIALP